MTWVLCVYKTKRNTVVSIGVVILNTERQFVTGAAMHVPDVLEMECICLCPSPSVSLYASVLVSMWVFSVFNQRRTARLGAIWSAGTNTTEASGADIQYTHQAGRIPTAYRRLYTPYTDRVSIC